MRLLANENIGGDVVAALRERGHDVLWIRADAPGISDEEVLRRAQGEDRILVTFDKDFGELALRRGLDATHGVILFRIAVSSPAHVVRVVLAALESRGDWRGHFSVVEETRIRMTPLKRR